jgi:uncharacterized membrane protein YphA (DoxX/SURF4 family)
MGALRHSAQGLLGLVFLGTGSRKLAGTDRMVDEFARLRYPQWIRLVTGAVEMGGGLAMLIGLSRPALVSVGGLLLGGTMLGALASHIRIEDPPQTMARPAMLLALAVAVSVMSVRQLAEAVGWRHRG